MVRDYARGSSSYKALGSYLNLASSSPAYVADDLAITAPAVGEDLCIEAQSFEAAATVAYSLTHLGMGLRFKEVGQNSASVLRQWLPAAD